MGELSLRHIPDLSDMSSVGDFSESSFQIPSAAHDADDLLLADETMGFFSGANDTLNTPAPPSRPLVQPPLTLDELTPVSKPSRAPIRSSLRPRPGITTPYRATVAHEISAALEETLLPLHSQEPSFEIPPPRRYDDDLMHEDSFLADAQSTLDRKAHDSSVSTTSMQPSPTRSSPPLPAEQSNFNAGTCTDLEQGSEDSSQPLRGLTSDMSHSSTSINVSHPSEVVPEKYLTPIPSTNGESKVATSTSAVGRTKKLVGDGKQKRKRVRIASAERTRMNTDHHAD